MQGYVLMEHESYADYADAKGWLIGSFYSDIESICRAITDDSVHKRQIVDVQYNNDGEKVLILASDGTLYGAYLCKMPMRSDMPTYERG